MIWILYRIELFKMVKRLASWVTFLGFAVLIIFMYGGLYYDAMKYEQVYFGFSDAWHPILSLGAPIASIFGAALIVLLVASEFDWRTSRQNIIDGLTKGQWFTAKVLLLPTIALLFYGFQLLFAGTLAWLGTDPAIGHAFVPAASHYLNVAGVLVGILCYSSIALLIALLTRSAGPALGITLIYQVFETIVDRTLRGMELDWLADYLPFQVHLALFRYDQYLPAGAEEPRYVKTAWDTGLLFATGSGWILVFLMLAWLVYRRRDL